MKKIAIIGSGISGLVCAHRLQHVYAIDIFEAAPRPGGHTHTVNIDDEREGPLAVDTGFIVFNDRTYPAFTNLLHSLGIGRQPTSMSFSVQCERTGLEYNGTSLNTLFAQRRNLVRPSFLRMIHGILRFNKAAKAFLADEPDDITFGAFIRRSRLNSEVVQHYLIPMCAAVWSADPKAVLKFPALFLLRFWQNHGFLEINDRPQWYVVPGGSHTYVSKILDPLADRLHLSSPVTGVRRETARDRVRLTVEGRGELLYDGVIFAVHSDQALRLLQDPTDHERRCLGAIPYQKNEVILHTDAGSLPRSDLARAAWNYFLPAEPGQRATVTYNMNILQNLPGRTLYNVTLNSTRPVPPATILRRMTYHHPVFTPAGMTAQEELQQSQGIANTWFCGAWMKNGFHEDGVVSALRVCQDIGVTPWNDQPSTKGASAITASPQGRTDSPMVSS